MVKRNAHATVVDSKGSTVTAQIQAGVPRINIQELKRREYDGTEPASTEVKRAVFKDLTIIKRKGKLSTKTASKTEKG